MSDRMPANEAEWMEVLECGKKLQPTEWKNVNVTKLPRCNCTYCKAALALWRENKSPVDPPNNSPSPLLCPVCARPSGQKEMNLFCLDCATPAPPLQKASAEIWAGYEDAKVTMEDYRHGQRVAVWNHVRGLLARMHPNKRPTCKECGCCKDYAGHVVVRDRISVNFGCHGQHGQFEVVLLPGRPR